MAERCSGLTDRLVTIGTADVDISVMYGRLHADWFTDERQSVIRSRSCQWARQVITHSDPSTWTCDDCRAVPRLRSFQRQLHCPTVVSSRTNNKYLSRTQLLALKSTVTDRTRFLSRRVSVLTNQLAKSRLQLCDERMQLRRDIERGDVAAVTHRLRALHREGAFADVSPSVRMAMDSLSSLCTPARGARRTVVTQELMQALKLEFGSGCVRFVHANLGLGGGSSVRRWIREDLQPFMMGIRDDNFLHAAEILGAIKKRLGITGPVLYQMAEDETAIQTSIDYDDHSDSAVGFCGPVCSMRHHLVTKCHCEDRHQCATFGDGSVYLGDSPDGDDTVYNRIMSVFATHKVATQGRVMMIVPLHPDLPSLVVLWAPCCGAISADGYVRKQWDAVDPLLQKHLEPIGLFQLGKASDGASTRRTLQYRDMSETAGIRYGLNVPGFTLTGLAVPGPDGKLLRLRHIHDQDYLHCAKKMLGSCDHAVRRLMVGQHCAHMHGILLVLDSFRPDQHGLWADDASRKGRNAMNWSSVVRVVSDRCLACLAILASGVRAVEVRGLLWYLRLIRRYIGLFADKSLTPLERVGTAWYVITTLRCWRLWVLKHDDLTLGRNFITRECFQDVILSCHNVILTVMAIRDLTPPRAVDLDRIGSNDCEKFFSATGSMAGNCRVYTWYQALLRIANRNHLNTIRARGNVRFPTNNRALETDLHVNRPPCLDPVTETNEVMQNELLRQGVLARDDLIAAGMGPPGGGPPDAPPPPSGGHSLTSTSPGDYGNQPRRKCTPRHGKTPTYTPEWWATERSLIQTTSMVTAPVVTMTVSLT